MMTIVPGINFLPLDVFGFIDNSISCICTTLCVTLRDYKDTALKAIHLDAQQAFYSGYIKAHSLKVKTIFLQNSLSTLYGLVSAP
jgi:hypothetical protein